MLSRWISLFGVRREQPKTRCPKETVKPQLEELLERILPSATPSPGTGDEATQLVATMMEQQYQWIVTLEQGLVNLYDTYNQRVAQTVAADVQQWEQFFGITPPTSGSGSGSGTITTTNNASNQQPVAIQPKSGSGVGSGATTSHENSPVIEMHPLTSGSGSGSGSGSLQFGSTDTLEWSPQGGSVNAGSPGNWIDLSKKNERLGAPTATNPVIFDGTVSDKAINWVSGGNVASIKLQEGYDAQMTIGADGTLTDNGTFTEGDTETLKVNFANAATFNIEGGGKITNMNLINGAPSGGTIGTMILTGGTTEIGASSGYQALIGVNFNILSPATLDDDGASALKFNSSRVRIYITGTMIVYAGGCQGPLIDNNGYSYNLIKVDPGGQLNYFGTGGTSTFTVPIYLQDGTLNVAADQPGGTSAGKLVVQDKSGYIFTGTNSKESVYLTGSYATVNLSNSATLECDDDYYQADGELNTLDSTTCTVQDGANSGRTANIAGGSVWINMSGAGYGILNVSASQLNFNGELNVAIAVSNPPTADVLSVTGTTNLQANSTLEVFDSNGPPAPKQSWIIITDTGGAAIALPNPNFQMPITTVPQANLGGKVDPTKSSQYIVTS